MLNRRLEALQTLRPHTHVVPGNHDHRGNMIDAGLLRADEGAVENKRCRRLSLGGGDWYLLDSLRFVDEIAGSLGSEQIDWLAAQLDAAPADRPAMVLTHHQPEDPQDPDDDGFGLADGAALLDMLREKKQVKAIFHGHRHAWTVREAHGIHIVGLPTTSYVFAEGENRRLRRSPRPARPLAADPAVHRPPRPSRGTDPSTGGSVEHKRPENRTDCG